MLLASVFTGHPMGNSEGNSWSPIDDRWFENLGGSSLAGVSISEDTARKISTVYRCVAILAGLVAYLPLFVMQHVGKNNEKAPNHPLYDLLHDQPNDQQTAFDWREMGMGHLLLRGNFYNEILPGPRGFVDQLIPLHPDRVTPRKLKFPSRRIVYDVYRDNGTTETLVQEQMFHIKGPSKDGLVGLNVIDYARETMGLATVAEQYGTKMFKNRPMMPGILKHPGKLDDAVSKRVAASFVAQTTGDNVGKPAVLEDGLEWISVGMTAENAQFLELRHFQIADLCRWFGVPLVLVGETEKSTTWGSGIESIMIGFVQTTLGPWLKRWEMTIKKDLILAPQFFAEFVMDALLRGTTAERYAAFSIATGGRAWLSPNEVRGLDNLNAVDGYDEIAKEAQGAAKAPAALPRREAQPSNAQARHMAGVIAGKIVHKELQAVESAAKRLASDSAEWSTWLADFYGKLGWQIVKELSATAEDAEDYCDGHRADLAERGVAVLAEWETSAAGYLVGLVMEDA
jgi:HK97 family phage portal protein